MPNCLLCYFRTAPNLCKGLGLVYLLGPMVLVLPTAPLTLDHVT
ncbi:hypothetical protein EYZ11_012322 [Aspergillus tanneri]|uniref:Uncharacterized protein n=1 Tax=Aspergillus tanneri TaxID=1220188 RepID=A0A4S3J5X7_9EURO|nr:hypothetical protein EYZ11_012322 [Aspergillus tanneri]